MVDFDPEPEDDGKLPARKLSKKMTFEPALGADGARCPCQTIERYESISMKCSDDDVRRFSGAFRLLQTTYAPKTDSTIDLPNKHRFSVTNVS